MQPRAYSYIAAMGLVLGACQNSDRAPVPDAAAPPTTTATSSPTATSTATPTSPPTSTATETDTGSSISTATETTTATAKPTDIATDTTTATSTTPTETATNTTTTTTPTQTATDTTTTTTPTQTATATSTFSYTAPDLTTFCTGGAAKMLVNGSEATPTVKGKVVACDGGKGGEFDVTSPGFAQPIAVSWQAQNSAFSSYSKLDLAKLPTGWSVRVGAGCGSASDCLDSYASDFVGSLVITIGKSAMYDMSLCLHVQEATSSPHALVHALDLFVPRVGAN
jgi:hypothetical protein